MALSSFDFQQARVKQVLFKSRLRSVLYGVRTAEPDLFAFAINPLGQWVATVAKPQLGNLPEVRTLESTIQQMLRIGQELATRYERGLIEEARSGLDQINAFADQIEGQLQRLESGFAAAA